MALLHHQTLPTFCINIQLPRCQCITNQSRHVQNSRRSACRATSLRVQQRELTAQLAQLLRADKEQLDAKHTRAVAQLVNQGVAALLASSDWHQLQQTFQYAAHQQHAALATQTGTSTSIRMPLRKASSRSAGFDSSRAVTLPQSSGKSPWGFALRQPQTAAAAQPGPQSPGMSALVKRSTPESDETAAVTTVQQQEEQQWDWAAVQQLVVLGLGSIGRLGLASSNAVSHASPSSRLGFRFFQLVIAKALAKTLNAGLVRRPTVYDPEFNSFDNALLTELGFSVLDDEPSHEATGSTLMYMPCCPRELYSTVLAANNGKLHQLAIFGTSMRSFADTQALVEALTTPALQTTHNTMAGVTQQQTAGNRQAGTPLEQQQQMLQQRQTTACADVLPAAYQQGCVLEVPCPDCAAHGVAVAIHVFTKQAVNV